MANIQDNSAKLSFYDPIVSIWVESGQLDGAEHLLAECL